MSTNGCDDLWPTKEFFENQQKFPPEEVAKYAGRYIAWSPEGNRILDSDEDDTRLWHKLPLTTFGV